MAGSDPWETGLEGAAASFVPLSLLSFLDRTVVEGHIQRGRAATRTHFRRPVSSHTKRGIEFGVTVTVIVPDVPAVVEAPASACPTNGAVLNTKNITGFKVPKTAGVGSLVQCRYRKDP